MLNLEEVTVDPVLAAKVPRLLALRKLVLPLSEVDGQVHVAVAQPPDATLAAVLERAFAPQSIVYETVAAASLRHTLSRAYGSAAGGAASEGGVEAVEAIFRSARLRRASDIHFNPLKGALEVRFRVDGRLEPYQTYPEALKAAIVNRIKVLAKLDIAERRSPQDGGFQLPAEPGEAGGEIDVRVATLPVKYGERLTLRLLAADRGDLTLESLGMREGHLKAFSEVLAAPHSLVLLTGPTGSGKSTTLYAAMKRLLELAPLNVLTVEDPIEYEIEGAEQCEVDSGDKVNFSKALKALLRHDPDVVMIGEIRDAESLDVAVKAALTGHLVLSSLHTNSAIGAVTRLEDMGLKPHLVAAVLRLAIAQRLVRRLCGECAGRGCLRCAGRGFRGRTALFELFQPDAAVRELIVKGATEQELLEHLLRQGYETLAADAEAKVAAGITSRTEILKVL